jgi:very-short-patch-repair endonuclease
MTRAHPSPAPLGHPLPQGEREEEKKISNLRPLSEIAKEQQMRRKNLPSPLAGEGGSAPLGALTGEGFAKLQAKRLRRDMTEAETKLWQNLRAKRFEDFKFRRQVAIGNYIADFVCYAQRVIVEVDGSQHEGSAHDAKRDAWLQGQGFRVVRLWNNGVLRDMDGALLTILDALRNPSPLVGEGVSRRLTGEGTSS